MGDLSLFAVLVQVCIFRNVVGTTNVPLYGTKTSYDISMETFSADYINDRELNWLELSRSVLPPPAADDDLELCTPIGLYAVYRHGTRNPSDGDIIDVNGIIDRLQNTNINQEFEFLRNATKIPVANASQLVETGWRELQELARGVTIRFPELFTGDNVDLSRYSFQSTNKSRTIDSARAFISGLVGDNQTCSTVYSAESFEVQCVENQNLELTPTTTVVPHSPIDADPLLRFYDVFEECVDAVNNGRTDAEQDGFRDGPEIGEVWERIAMKLAAPGADSFNISREEVILLTEICGYDRAINNDNNTWCRLFELDDLPAPEYHSELKDYWSNAYGFDINYRISCTLAQDVLDYLEMRTNSHTTSLADFKFAHSDTVVALTSLLGLFNTTVQPVMSNFPENTTRTFRSAKIIPFASNIAFALYQCVNQSQISYAVQVLHNERPVLLDFCASYFCTMDEFRRGVKLAIGACNFDKECSDALPDSTLGPEDGSTAVVNYSVCLTFLPVFVIYWLVFQ